MEDFLEDFITTKKKEKQSIDKILVSEDVLITSMLYTELICKTLKNADLEIWGYYLGPKDKFDGVVTNTVLKPYHEISGASADSFDENKSIKILQKYLDKTNQKRLGIWHGHANFGPFHSGKDRRNLNVSYHKLKEKNIFKLGEKTEKLINGSTTENLDKENKAVSLTSSDLIPVEFKGSLNGKTQEEIIDLLKSIEITKPYGPAFFYSVVFDKYSIGCVNEGKINPSLWAANYGRRKRIYDGRLLLQDFEGEDKDRYTGLDDEVKVQIIKKDNNLNMSQEFLLESIMENVIFDGKLLKESKDRIYRHLGLYKEEKTEKPSRIKKSFEAQAKESMTGFTVHRTGKPRFTKEDESLEEVVAHKEDHTTEIPVVQEIQTKEEQQDTKQNILKQLESEYEMAGLGKYLTAFDKIKQDGGSLKANKLFGNFFTDKLYSIDYATAFQAKDTIKEYLENAVGITEYDHNIANEILTDFDSGFKERMNHVYSDLDTWEKEAKQIFYNGDNQNNFVVESHGDIHNVKHIMVPSLEGLGKQLDSLTGKVPISIYGRIKDSQQKLSDLIYENIENQIELLKGWLGDKPNKKIAKKYHHLMGEWRK